MENYTPYNELKIFRHTDRIADFLEGKRGEPIYIRIKPTNVCNQQCYYCAYANDSLFDGRNVNKRESIPWEILRKTIDEMAEIGVKAVTFSGGGEPLCYPYIIDAFKMLDKHEIDYSIITNGQALEGECIEYIKKAKWVRISFDSSRKETYEKIRGVHTYEQILNNIKKFAYIKDRNCTLGINCVVTHDNADDIFEICKLVKALGVDNIKISPILIKTDEEKYHERIKESVIEQIQKAKLQLEDEKFHIVDKYTNDVALQAECAKSYSQCYIQNFFTVIAADAKVYRCHQRAYTKEGEIGDLTKKSFKEIWYSKETLDNIKRFCPQESCKFSCAFHERNKLLDEFINMDMNHVNFI